MAGSVQLLRPDLTPAPPTALVARLKEIDECLDVVWNPYVEKWAVIERWRPTDKRWELYHQGIIGSPFDIFDFFPRDADPESAADWMVERLCKQDFSKPDVRSRLARIRDVQRHNALLREKVHQAAVEPVIDEVKYQARGILRNPGRIGKEENVGIEVRGQPQEAPWRK